MHKAEFVVQVLRYFEFFVSDLHVGVQKKVMSVFLVAHFLFPSSNDDGNATGLSLVAEF
jgi:hypothetical protein